VPDVLAARLDDEQRPRLPVLLLDEGSATGWLVLLPMWIGVSWRALDQLGEGGDASLPTKNVPGPAAPSATASAPRWWKPLRSVRSGV
jgi:hypothetical protein